MPKYANTIIYKIVCNDLNIPDCYVGHTTHFTKRKQSHKYHACSIESNKHDNLKIYTTIRSNGGWNNWAMIEVEKFPCIDANEAKAREHYYYELFHAKLNSVRPLGLSQAEYYQQHKVEKSEYNKQYYQQYKAESQRQRNMRYICDSKLGVSGGQGVWHHAHRRAPLPVHVLKNQGRGT